jgi:uncharacterized RDD family membrane protein YckC
MHTTPLPLNLPPATLRRRLGAVLYDSLLLAGTLLAASALALLVVVGFIGAEQVKLRNPLISNPFFSTYLFFIGFFFYAWFWTHGGQTLGMRAWKIRIQQLNGHGITWWQALLRFLLAGLWVLPIFYARKVLNLSLGLSLGVGFCFLLLILASRLHDRYSGTVLIVIKPQDQPVRRKA